MPLTLRLCQSSNTMPSKKVLKMTAEKVPKVCTKNKVLKQTYITDYYNEFTVNMDVFAFFTPYKSSKQWARTFLQKNWQ